VSPQPAIVGRFELLRFIQDCAHWPRGGRPLPVVVLFGPRGRGKTTVLRAALSMAEQIHVANIDVAGRRFDTATQVMIELVLQLGLRRRGLGVLSFPRFLLGQLAIQVEISEYASARPEMRRLLSELKQLRLPPRVKELAGKMADVGVSMSGTTPVPTGTGDVLVSSMEAAFGWRRMAGETWWEEREGRPAPDALAELHRCTHRGTDEERAVAEELLAEALLADLHASYRDTSAQRGVPALVLLDNAHTGAGARFLSLVTQRRARRPDLLDPLLVIAASGRALADIDHPVAGTSPLTYRAWVDRWSAETARAWFGRSSSAS